MLRRCTRCLYDENTPSIVFDDQGVCNYCHSHDQMDREYPTGVEGEKRLQAIAERIRKAGRGKKYDVIVGVSGGCDSSYMLHLAKNVMGLRPLAVHFDNTYNSTTAVENIQNVLKKLDIDLFTYVVDNEEYDDIYRSFLKAGVPDIEAPTDIGLAAVLYMAAEKFGVRCMLEGHSFRTEGVSPLGWLYMDGKYIESIQKQFGTRKLKTYPNLWLSKFIWWTALGGIEKIRPLYYIDYHKKDAMEMLSRDYDWKWYGGHHLENRFTAFYHSYFMPKRWGFDFRVLGYAALTRSGQMDREEGLRLLASPPRYDPGLVEFIQRRLGFSNSEWAELFTQAKHNYREFNTYKKTFERLKPFWWLMYRLGRVPKSFYAKFTAPAPATPETPHLPSIEPVPEQTPAVLPAPVPADPARV